MFTVSWSIHAFFPIHFKGYLVQFVFLENFKEERRMDVDSRRREEKSKISGEKQDGQVKHSEAKDTHKLNFDVKTIILR